MKVTISKDWCLRMAQLEGDTEIGAGLLASDDRVTDETMPVVTDRDPRTSLAFGRFVRLMRRQRGVDIEKLADEADVDVADLLEIERNPRHLPQLRTTYQLARYFDVPKSNLMQVAGLTKPKDVGLQLEAVRFAARSEPTSELTPEEGAALDAFVAVLSKR